MPGVGASADPSFDRHARMERPGEDIGDGLARLAEVATRHRAVPPEACTDAIKADLLGEVPSDDVAVLAVLATGER